MIIRYINNNNEINVVQVAKQWNNDIMYCNLSCVFSQSNRYFICFSRS